MLPKEEVSVINTAQGTYGSYLLLTGKDSTESDQTIDDKHRKINEENLGKPAEHRERLKMVATKAHYENLYSLDGNKQYVVGKKDDQFILLDNEPFKTAPPFNFEG